MTLLGESPAWIALDKPAGLPVFPPHGDPAGDCVLHRLLALRPQQGALPWPAGFEGGIAHRLDTPTSGQLLVATSLASLAAIRARFAGGALRKRYRFLTRRTVPWAGTVIDRPIAHDRHRRARMVVQRGLDSPHRGRWYPARTELRERASFGALWAWTAIIETGVTHQVRLHAAFAGLALAGDALYGGGEPTEEARAYGAREGVAPPFHLHHVGLVGLAVDQDADPPPAPVPPWWSPS